MDYALVFAGGGGKGAYEIGAWKAMHERGLDSVFQSVIGTSVGALNAALFGQQNIETAERIWRELSNSKILSANAGTGEAMFSQVGLENLLKVNISGSYQKNVYVCCSRTDTLWDDASIFFKREKFFGLALDEHFTTEYIKLNGLSKQKQIQYLLASSALPAVYDSVCIEGKKYRDGGLIKEHNLPCKKAVDLGYKYIFAVDLEKGYSGEKYIGSSKVYILRPSQSLGDLVDGTIDFDRQNAIWRMELGYRDFLAHENEIRLFMDKANISTRMPEHIRNRLKNMV